MNIKQVTVPQVLKMKPTHYYAQLRPMREGGLRLEKEVRGGKTIIHNYGHGNVGISLSPGTAHEAVTLASNEAPRTVAVLGSGIVGLFTAKYYLETHPNTPLTIYAERVPPSNTKQNSRLVTSQVPPGYWIPSNYVRDTELNLRLGRHGYKQYSSMRDSSRYGHCVSNLTFVDISEQSMIDDALKPGGSYYYYPKEVKETFKRGKIRITNSGKVVEGVIFQTLRVNLRHLISAMLEEVQQLGAVVVERKITKQSLPHLKEDLIFNCSGLGSRELFDDPNVYGLKGHLIEYPNPNPSKFDFFFNMNHGQQAMTIYMHQDRILLGKTTDRSSDTNIETDKIEQLLAKHRDLMIGLGVEKSELRPKL